MKRMKLISVLAAVILGLILILQNTQPVATRILFFKFTMPNAVVIGLALLVGIAIGILIALIGLSKRESTEKDKP